MLPSGAELPKSLTDYVNCECSVQPVAFEWYVVTNRSITSVPHEENTGWRSFPLCLKGLAHMLSREHLPGCCVNLEGELAWAWCPSGCKTWGDESLGRSVWTIWSRLPWWCMKQPWRCLTSGTVPETWVEARTQLHRGALPPSPTYWCAGLPAAWTMSIAAYGSPAMPHLWLEASVKRVISASKALSETPCSSAGEDHQAASWRMVRVTEILSDLDPVSWHQASDAHHWIGRGGRADLLALGWT